ncbi:MAG: hypothetical protein CM15mP29_4440 [Alphaproteobacteria bacterium]|nr:MAG: hypothetical protein CM15mP29_4440 [Alphaproteobacteria bacterium]
MVLNQTILMKKIIIQKFNDEVKPSRKERSINAKLKEDEDRAVKNNTTELELTENDNKIKDVNFLK